MATAKGVPVGTVRKLLDLESDRRVQQLVKEGVLPPQVKRGQYDLTGSVIAYIRYLNRRIDGKEDQSNGLNLDAERARLAKEQADKAAMENAVRRGDLVDLNIIGPEWEKNVMATRAKLLAIPSKLAPLAFQAKAETEIQAVLEMAIHEALKELADGSIDRDAIVEVDAQGDGDVPAAAKTKGKRVGRPVSKTKSGGKRRAGGVEDKPG